MYVGLERTEHETECHKEKVTSGFLYNQNQLSQIVS